ncbi:MAG: hypothetical protein OHK0038_20420 [Flammeovirgaceae bacterium]
MRKNNAGLILLIDNDVMVFLFKYLYDIDKNIFNKVITFLGIRYPRIWIPKTVKKEFYIHQNDKQRTKRLNKILKTYPFIKTCPIKVSEKEITILIGNQQENKGEADAILQARKAQNNIDLFFQEIYFLTNDKGAIRLANQMGVEYIDYEDFRNKLKEIGIIIP